MCVLAAGLDCYLFLALTDPYTDLRSVSSVLPVWFLDRMNFDVMCEYKTALEPELVSHFNVTAGHEDDHENSDGGLAVAEDKPQLKRPPMYKVVLLNDDYTPMEFVVEILETFFSMGREQATQVMLQVHTQGKGVCGIYTRDIAETKAAQVNQCANESEHPLLCEIEAVEDDE